MGQVGAGVPTLPLNPAMPQPPTDTSKLGPIVAGYGFARRKIWPFLAMLVAMMLFGLAGVATQGLEGQWGLVFLLIVLPGAALVILAIELRLPGPILLIGEAGLKDRRKDRPMVRWAEIQEATPRGRLVGRGVRIVLTSGERYDIDLSLLDVEPADVISLIREHAARSEAANPQ